MTTMIIVKMHYRNFNNVLRIAKEPEKHLNLHARLWDREVIHNPIPP